MENSNNIKKYYLLRLKIAGFILALVGWFLLIIVILESVFEADLSGLESIVESSGFKWGIRIFVIFLFLILINGVEKINVYIQNHPKLQNIINIFVLIGIIGWIIGLGSLVL